MKNIEYSDWKKLFKSHILERGREYAINDAVIDLTKSDDQISAVVEGTEYYKVRISLFDNRITDGYCSCPYASKGEWCKHMAAVFFACDNDFQQEANNKHNSCDSPVRSLVPIKDMVEAASPEQLKKILVELAAIDIKAEYLIRAAFSIDEKKTVINVAAIMREIDGVFLSYSDRSGYIDYYSAFDFSISLNNLLRDRIGMLIDSRQYMDAFNASMHAFIRLGNCDIDDDGEITSIAAVCYELWQKIVSLCDSSEKEQIKAWFTKHSDDGTVIDYMEDILQEFLRYELASEEELKDLLAELEAIIEKCKGKAKCDSIFSYYYGYSTDALKMRNIIAKRLGATSEEIENYMRKYMSFDYVRDYFIQQARDRHDADEEIRLLIMGKEYDKESSYEVHKYSERLIELYSMKKDFDAEKRERRFDIFSNQSATLKDYKAYKDMCSDEEWTEERNKLIRSRESIEKKCELLANEKMMDGLFKIIWAQKNKLSLINKYGFLLAGDYSEYILDYYSRFVSELAEAACNRSRYDELERYLIRMTQYLNGDKRVKELSSKWINMYPTRKVMVQMLRKWC